VPQSLLFGANQTDVAAACASDAATECALQVLIKALPSLSLEPLATSLQAISLCTHLDQSSAVVQQVWGAAHQAVVCACANDNKGDIPLQVFIRPPGCVFHQHLFTHMMTHKLLNDVFKPQ
jgi:hypothetical protein